MPAGGNAGDAITAARFGLTIDGYEFAVFSELVGIASEAGGVAGPPTVTLRRALTADMQVATWHEAAVQAAGGAARKSAVLIMHDTAGEPVARYLLDNAWPSRLEIGALKAGSHDALLETVTLSCERIQRVAA